MDNPQFDAMVDGRRALLAPLTAEDVREAVVMLRLHGLAQVLVKGELIDSLGRWADGLADASRPAEDDEDSRSKKKKRKADPADKRAGLVLNKDEVIAFNASRALRMAFWPMFRLVVGHDLGANDAAVFDYCLDEGCVKLSYVCRARIERPTGGANDDDDDDSEKERYLSEAEVVAALSRLFARGVLVYGNSADFAAASAAMDKRHQPLAGIVPFACGLAPQACVVDASFSVRRGETPEAWRPRAHEASAAGRFRALYPGCKLGEVRPCVVRDDVAAFDVAANADKGVEVNDGFLVRAHVLDLLAQYLARRVGDALAFEVVRAALALCIPASLERLPKLSEAVKVHEVWRVLKADRGLFPHPGEDASKGVRLMEEVLEAVCAQSGDVLRLSQKTQWSTATVSVALELGLVRLRQAAVNALVQDALGLPAQQVFGVLLSKGAIEESLLSRSVLMAPERARAALNQLVAAQLAVLQEVPRRNEFHPASMATLWSVSEPLAIYRFAMLANKAGMNLLVRAVALRDKHAALMQEGEGDQRYKDVAVAQARIFKSQSSLWRVLVVLSDVGAWTEQMFGSHAAMLAADQAYADGVSFLPRPSD